MSRVVDWRLFVSMSIFTMVCYLVYVGVNGVQDSAHKGDRIDELIAADKDDDAAAARDRENAADQRRRLLENQRRLLGQYERLDERQQRLLAFLEEAGIETPDFLDEPASGEPRKPQGPQEPDPDGSGNPDGPGGEGNPPGDDEQSPLEELEDLLGIPIPLPTLLP